ncbi:unnamed protein product [Effrenium voratum]|uniref:Uncharacterized protein n=1 Tax=Effrenium voratum TaxID=2562239 RepID=A0AA36I8M1_9DINO|nr:unnamed protein product [Effrenium voratum]CAJ1381694.1 unnamed protein product [Effrenium voratum]CAJ1429172.1 unnamed protein product [Effrenium voratum]
MTDTYTLGWWSKYLDFFSWRLLNFPLGVAGPLDPYVGRQIQFCFFRLPLEEELKAMEADGLPPPNNWLCESQKLMFFRLRISNNVEHEDAFEECVDFDELEEDVEALAEKAIKA